MKGDFASRSYFQAADYAVCGLTLLASLAIGLYYGVKDGGQRTSASYVLADRSMTVVPVTLSLLASFFSGIALQGFSADVYFHGPTIVWMNIPFLLGAVLTLVFFLPIFYRLGMVSAYEYLELRFSHAVKIAGVLGFLFFTVFYTGLVAYTACVAATSVTGIGTDVAIVVLCAVCAVYTVIGGIRAVLWTDSLQMMLMLSTTLAIVIKAISELGLSNIWQIAADGSRTNFLRFTSDLTVFYNGWAFIAQVLFVGFIFTNQYMVQRMVVCKSEAVARRSVTAYAVASVLFMFLLCMVGISMYSYYEGCDPSTLGHITKNDEIVPYFIVDVFSDLPGMPGLLLSGLFGAALSTLSSVFNATATLVGEHFVKPYFAELKDLTYTLVLKLIVVVASAVALGVAFLVPFIGDAIPVIVTISGCINGALVALYILGAFVPFCDAKAALTGFIIGMAFGVVMSVGCIIYQVKPDHLPLSADVCLNDTSYIYINETSVVPVDQTVTLWNVSVTEMVTVASSEHGARSETPVIFTLAKSWLGFATFAVIILVALPTTLITGGNDTSTMDPRLVVWRIKSSYVPFPTDKLKEDDYSIITDKDQDDCKSSESEERSETEKESLQTQRITAV